jgi:DNA polymerase-3 subunit gamma/tau
LNNPLSEEDKKKILIEPIAEFSIPIKQQETPVTSIHITENQPKDALTNEQSVKKNILRVGIKEETEEIADKSILENRTQKIQAEPFTEEELRMAWKKCANEITDKHLKSIMLHLNPELIANDTLEINAVNPEQMHYIQQNSNQISEYLFSHLKNNQIKIDIKIKEDDTEPIPFTAQEKYVYMADKNPFLKKLVQEFNLRLD